MSKKSKTKLTPFRVYIEQVNQQWVEVKAKTRDQAVEKGYRKWRRECAHSRVTYVEPF